MNARPEHLEPADLVDRFPPDFSWGTATSAFQIEGATSAGGRGASIWDTFCRQPGAIADQSNGDTACDHYHRYAEDLDLVQQAGFDAYRFSIAWPRIQPAGRGAWNDAGLDFYDRLLDALLERGLTPHVTLNHWDLPQALQDSGGWAQRDTVPRFSDYAVRVVQALGDRIAYLTTHNEPFVQATLGHELGIFAPGLRDRRVAAQVSHHLLLSHGVAARAVRETGFSKPLGIVLNLSPIHAATNAPADMARVRLEDGILNRWYLDPLKGRGYPEDVWAHLGADAPLVAEGDLGLIAEPIDFLGVNYYTRTVFSASGVSEPSARHVETTAMGWEVYPDGLHELLVRLHRDYAFERLFITENGAAFDDRLVEGAVHDEARIDYLQSHMSATLRAVEQGVPVKGYMVWSLLDNFEWASGYQKRFGIVHVDYETLKRTPKDSALWLARCLRRRK